MYLKVQLFSQVGILSYALYLFKFLTRIELRFDFNAVVCQPCKLKPRNACAYLDR
jgi:hypothetical protein